MRLCVTLLLLLLLLLLRLSNSVQKLGSIHPDALSSFPRNVQVTFDCLLLQLQLQLLLLLQLQLQLQLLLQLQSIRPSMRLPSIRCLLPISPLPPFIAYLLCHRLRQPGQLFYDPPPLLPLPPLLYFSTVLHIGKCLLLSLFVSLWLRILCTLCIFRETPSIFVERTDLPCLSRLFFYHVLSPLPFHKSPLLLVRPPLWRTCSFQILIFKILNLSSC